jgi:putative Mg2+ transporter-C (MgtC) family protein
VPDLPADLSGYRLELLLELVLAVLLGGVIGFERELKARPAGLRTNILICMAAVLFADLSHRTAQDGGDPGRIAAQILTGVGFIGAGTIIRDKGSVIGLTSAATIWMVTAIGIALGFGAYLEAIGATVLVVLVLAGLGRLERVFEERPVSRSLTVHLDPESARSEVIEQALREAGFEVTGTRDDGRPVLHLRVRGAFRRQRRARSIIREQPGVRRVSEE